MNYSNMPRKKQVDAHAEIRTKGLTILAHILAASLVRGHDQHRECSDKSDCPVDPSQRDKNEAEANDGIGDEH